MHILTFKCVVGMINDTGYAFRQIAASQVYNIVFSFTHHYNLIYSEQTFCRY